MTTRVRVGVLTIMIAIIVFASIAFARQSPALATAGISGILIGKNLRTDFTDYFRMAGSAFTCEPDSGTHWACSVMLEGKPLEMVVSYQMSPSIMLTGCSVIYDGNPVACQFTLGNGRSAVLIVDDDLGISKARMAEIRAENPILYLSESFWLSAGFAVAAILAFLVVLILLTIFNREYAVVLVPLKLRMPLWAVCLATLLLTVLVTSMTGLLLVLPLGIAGILVVSVVVAGLNYLHKKRGVDFAHPLMWIAVTVSIVWLMNLTASLSLLMTGIVD